VKPRAARRHGLALAGLAAAALVAVALLVTLGVWQVERRAWKHALIAAVDTRIHAAPVPAPGPAEWPRITADRDAYRRISATGRFLHDRETLVRATTALGSGYWVMTPLQIEGAGTSAGQVVLINRGFVPQDRRDPATRGEGSPAAPASAPVTVTGLLRVSEPGGGFLRTNDPAGDRWYSRDVAAFAAARRVAPAAPYFIDADATANPGGYPVGGLTVISFPDNHLGYAITWFALALMTAGGAFMVGRHEWRARRGDAMAGE